MDAPEANLAECYGFHATVDWNDSISLNELIGLKCSKTSCNSMSNFCRERCSRNSCQK